MGEARLARSQPRQNQEAIRYVQQNLEAPTLEEGFHEVIEVFSAIQG